MYQLITHKKNRNRKKLYITSQKKEKKKEKKENTAYFKLQSAYFVSNE